ncbi:MAG: hypothetical protein AAF702_13085 [Chloroflexota bacterium]
MSGYQFYEFQTIDNPLSDQERTKISALSSRVELSATRAAFVYHYGSFRGKPKELLAEHFDAYLYVSNWGTKQLMFRFPADLVDVKSLRVYELSYAIEVTDLGSTVILDLTLNDEDGGGWIEDGEYQLTPYLGLHSAILQGDYRGIYLAWLGCMGHSYEINDDELSPPIPDGLGQLDTLLKNVSTYFEADPHMIAAASRHSQVKVEGAIDIREALAQLSDEEKDDFLIRLAEGESLLNVKLMRRLQPDASGSSATQQSWPTVGQLRTEAEKLSAEAEQKASAKAERERVEALEALALREEQAWTDVQRLIEEGQARPYEEAVALLVQLRDLAIHRNEPGSFEQRMSGLRQTYRRRSALIRRFDNAQL